MPPRRDRYRCNSRSRSSLGLALALGLCLGAFERLDVEGDQLPPALALGEADGADLGQRVVVGGAAHARALSSTWAKVITLPLPLSST